VAIFTGPKTPGSRYKRWHREFNDDDTPTMDLKEIFGMQIEYSEYNFEKFERETTINLEENER